MYMKSREDELFKKMGFEISINEDNNYIIFRKEDLQITFYYDDQCVLIEQCKFNERGEIEYTYPATISYPILLKLIYNKLISIKKIKKIKKEENKKLDEKGFVIAIYSEHKYNDFKSNLIFNGYFAELYTVDCDDGYFIGSTQTFNKKVKTWKYRKSCEKMLDKIIKESIYDDELIFKIEELK